MTKEYAQHPQSQIVQTAWAILALIYAKYPKKEVIEQGVRLIMSRQKPDGRWDQEDTEGIFNKNCSIDYPGGSISTSSGSCLMRVAFKFVFCVWALGRADKYLRQ